MTGGDLDQQIAELIAAGLRDDQAAVALGVSTGSWRKHKARVLRARRRNPRGDR